MTAVSFRGVSTRFSTGSTPVENVDLDVSSGEILVLSGRPRSGMSTLLDLAAGLIEPMSGTVRLDGVAVSDVPTQDRRMAMVSRNQSLYRRLSVADNIGQPLKLTGVHPVERSRRVTSLAHRLGLSEVLDRRPHQLSATESARVALGRAVIREPRLLLMDDPFAEMSGEQRSELLDHIAEQLRHLHATVLFATTDPVGTSIADRVAVLGDGRIEDLGTPRRLLARPATARVAVSVGDRPMNLVEVVVHVDLDRFVALETETRSFRLPWRDVRSRALAHYHGDRIVLGLRPESIHPPSPDRSDHVLHGRVLRVEQRGTGSVALLDVGANAVEIDKGYGAATTSGGSRWSPFRRRASDALRNGGPAPTTIMTPLSESARPAEFAVPVAPNTVPRPGQNMAIAFRMDDVHFFDDGGHRIDAGRGFTYLG